VRNKTEIIALWECPKCGRQFEKRNQSHSCKKYPLEQHFIGKINGQLLYEKLKLTLEKTFDLFKIESLACCIHFVSTFTFTAVKVIKDKISIDFSLNHKVINKRIKQITPISKNRFLHSIDVFTEAEIDEELVEWIREAHDKK
jgi:hypothetical protein